MRFVRLWMHGNLDLPGGVRENYISTERGFEIWREDSTGGFWVKKGAQVARWVGPASVQSAEPHPDDVPDAPSAKRGPGRPPKNPEPTQPA